MILSRATRNSCIKTAIQTSVCTLLLIKFLNTGFDNSFIFSKQMISRVENGSRYRKKAYPFSRQISTNKKPQRLLTLCGSEKNKNYAYPSSYGEQGWFPDNPPRTHEVSWCGSHSNYQAILQPSACSRIVIKW